MSTQSTSSRASRPAGLSSTDAHLGGPSFSTPPAALAPGGQVLRAALASRQHWRAECHGSSVCASERRRFPSQLPQTSLPTDWSDSLLPAAGMGAWPHLDSPAVHAARAGFRAPHPTPAPDCEPRQLPLFASGFQHGLGIFLLPFAGACPPHLLTLRLNVF